MRVDAIIVPRRQAKNLADQIARLWLVDDAGTALDLAVVECLVSMTAQRPLWAVPGSEFRPWRADNRDWSDTAFCSFWWD